MRPDGLIDPLSADVEQNPELAVRSSGAARHMHTVTFYSFKGGVGRTMALANVAAELARAGRRVLLVDFDLEAPGLDTLPLGADPVQARTTPGIVDFVHQYLERGVVPAVRPYLYRCDLDRAGISDDTWLSPDGAPGNALSASLAVLGRMALDNRRGRREPGGELWVMPAGRDDGAYAERLAGINWADLYAHQDGYVLFEDLKAQWQDVLAPDYVFIDSRTGHTDVGGICTRQLPDAVALVFIPNEQNLRGLAQVVRDIRSEEHGPRTKRIALHFVASNVPAADDEAEILARRLRAFRRRLRINGRPLVVHRYDSLDLLTQSIFTLTRPRTRLAREYRQLALLIQSGNASDPAGALDFLDRVLHDRVKQSPRELDERLDAILRRHASDTAVLLRLAEVRQRQGRSEEAVAILADVTDSGRRGVEASIALAESLRTVGRVDEAASEARRVFDFSDVELGALARAVRIIRAARPGLLAGLANSTAVMSLNGDMEREWLAEQLGHSRLEWREVRAMYETRQTRRADGSRTAIEAPSHGLWLEYVLALLGTGDFARAANVLGPRVERDDAGIADIFNAAMAIWGRDALPPVDLFQRVANIAADDETALSGANYSQCLAVAWWQAGHSRRAVAHLEQASRLIAQQPRVELSCWRYLRVTPDEFEADLDEMRRAISGANVRPPFLDAALAD